MQAFKRCTKCGVMKSVKSFYPRIDRPVGLRSRCKECYTKLTSAYRRTYKQARRQHFTDVQRAYYHRVQDEAGCHQKPGNFYPGYKLLKALETAEVVEI